MTPVEVPLLVRRASGAIVVASWVPIGSALAGGGLSGPSWWAVPSLAALVTAAALLVRACLSRRSLHRAAAGVVLVTAVVMASTAQLGDLVELPASGQRLWVWHIDLMSMTAVALLALGRPVAPALGGLTAFAALLAAVRSGSPFSLAPLAFDIADAAFLVAATLTLYGGFSAVQEVAVRVERAREDARSQADAAAGALAAEAERVRWEALVHDDVLSALAAARRGGPREAQIAARRALEKVRADPRGGDASLEDVRLRLVQVIHDAGGGATLDVVFRGPGHLPGAVADALVDATHQLVRNVGAHAGPGARCTVRGDLAPGSALVVVEDDGGGFDPEGVTADRLGLRGSVHRRLAAIGGTASIASAPGRGTRAHVAWRADDGSGRS